MRKKKPAPGPGKAVVPPARVLSEPKATALAIPDRLSLEDLSGRFHLFVDAVERQLAAEEANAPDSALAHAGQAKSSAGAALEGVTDRDELVALIYALGARASRIRLAVRGAEQLARRYERLEKFIREAVCLYMDEAGIERVEGMVHRFALYRQPDQLIVANEQLVPDDYFDRVVSENRVLNRERLLEALTRGVEIPGAYLEKNRRRLDVK